MFGKQIFAGPWAFFNNGTDRTLVRWALLIGSYVILSSYQTCYDDSSLTGADPLSKFS